MTVKNTSNYHTKYCFLVLFIIVGVTSMSSLAVAAGSTSVTVAPAQSSSGVGESITFDIVIEDAANGVGAWEMQLNLTNETVADISSITLHGNPDLRTVNIGENQNSVYFDAALADTEDTGSVTIATVTLKVRSAGETNLALTVDALGDEAGNSYSVAGITNGALSTRSDSSSSDRTETEAAEPTETDRQTRTEDTSTTDNQDSETGDTEGAVPTTTAGRTDEQTTDNDGDSASGTATADVRAEGSTPGFTALISLFSILIGLGLLRRRG